MKNFVLRAMLVGLLCAAIAPFALAAPAYTFVTVQNPNDTAFTQLLGINNTSTIAGYWGDGAVVPNHGFTLALPSTFTSENFPAAAQTQVIGINNTGWNDGFYTDTGGVTHGFTFNGSFTTLDAPGTAFNQLLGINDGLTAVGYSSTDTTGATLQRSFTESGGVFTYIDGFLPSGTQNNQAVGINNSGMVVGFYVDSTGNTHGYLLNTGTLTSLNFPGSTFTAAFGINNSGAIVGVYVDSGGTQHGFLYNGTWNTLDVPQGVLGSTTINGINDKGQIVGFFTDANDNVDGFVGTPTPEPGSLLLLGGGMLAGLGVLRRRMRV
jgi:probable HAF family extracellular repeat protein